MTNAAWLPWLPWLEPALMSALRQRGHALLIHGPQGVGQWELAQRLAALWLCEAHSAESTAPCGQCAACRLLQAGTHPDVRWAVPDALRATLLSHFGGGVEGEGADDGKADDKAKGKAAGRDVRVQDIRAAIDWSHQTSSRGRGKVLVVFPAERLNTVAANALLKTLEEPPAGVRLVLAGGDAQALLPTLRSRCQRIAVSLPAPALALRWLVEQGVQDAAPLLAVAGGRPGDAVRLAHEGWNLDRLQRFPSAVREGRLDALAGLPLTQAVDLLQKLCSDALQGLLGLAPSFFPAGSVPPGASAGALRDGWRRLLDAARQADHPWNAPLKLDALLMEAQAWWPMTDEPPQTRR